MGAGRWLIGALGGAVLVFAAGPRPRVRLEGTAPAVPSAPMEAAEMIAKREGAVDDLRPDTEARVVWAGEAGVKTPLAFVYLHGFSASRRETAPLSERVAQRFGANLFEARLTGHGRPGEAFGQATAEDWVRDTREAIAVGRALGERVVVIGASTGGTLAMLVAAEGLADADAYILLSPNFGPRNAASSLLTWPWAERWVPLLMGEERSWEPENADHGKYWTTRYPVAALFPMMALVDRVRSADLGKITRPVLVLHSNEDPVVDPESIESAFVRLTSAEPRQRQVIDGPGDHHVIAGDILSPERTTPIADRVQAFLQGAGFSAPTP